MDIPMGLFQAVCDHLQQDREVMNQISETFLLTIAQASATLLGLLMVAAFSYVETGLQRVSAHVPEARSYLRSTTKAIVALYSFALPSPSHLSC